MEINNNKNLKNEKSITIVSTIFENKIIIKKGKIMESIFYCVQRPRVFKRKKKNYKIITTSI